MLGWNLYYIFAITVIACGSIPKGTFDQKYTQTRVRVHINVMPPGYDEGGFSASTGLPSFKEDFGLLPNLWKGDQSGLANRKANISSFAVLGAAFGALGATGVTDRLGRLRSWQLFVVLWLTGIFMQVFASGILGLMLFARIWGGLGAGGLTVVAPLYLSEIAPAKSRGMVVSIYMIVLLSFLTLGICSCLYFYRYGF